MTRKVVTINFDSNVFEAAKLMDSNKIGCLVVTEGNIPVGIVTERDLVRKVLAKKLPADTKISEIASKPLITVNCDTSIKEAARIMSSNKIRRLPVVNENKLAGIVVAADFVRHHGKTSISEYVMAVIARS